MNLSLIMAASRISDLVPTNFIGNLKLIKEAKKRNLDKIELHAIKDGEPIYRQFEFIEPHNKVLELIL